MQIGPERSLEEDFLWQRASNAMPGVHATPRQVLLLLDIVSGVITINHTGCDLDTGLLPLSSQHTL